MGCRMSSVWASTACEPEVGKGDYFWSRNIKLYTYWAYCPISLWTVGVVLEVLMTVSTPALNHSLEAAGIVNVQQPTSISKR